MARSRSILASILIVDALLLCAWCSSCFVSGPSSSGSQLRGDINTAATAAAVVAATQFPGFAEAAEKWEYKEPTGALAPGQSFVLLSFFFIHAAGVADFYAKKTGSGPAVPWNPFRERSITTTFKLGDFQ
eukprot:TRINITY_DN1735_c0_g1_i4.p1 TRINITY_DN1735_c0_g1~~TRINITY_DN1735_c0_g1_i4.p1  ORF type:complete len:130 (+),score=33.55 TRINITY_DN1735_c0_g1_i4:180-569(+)